MVLLLLYCAMSLQSFATPLCAVMTLLHYEVIIEPQRREGREEGVFVGFVMFLEERIKIRTDQALTS